MGHQLGGGGPLNNFHQVFTLASLFEAIFLFFSTHRADGNMCMDLPILREITTQYA